jgi:putative oxidoreductase
MASVVVESKVSPLEDWVDVLGRAALAALFLWSAYTKFAYMEANVGYMKAYGMPAAALLIWPAALVELAGGAMLLLGWKARWAAVALALFTLVAMFIFHAYWSVPADQVQNQQIHFMKNFAIIGGLLVVFARGSGRYAIERG